MGFWGHSQGHTHNTTCSCVQKHTRMPDTGSQAGIKGSSAHTLTSIHPGTRGCTVRGTPGAFFQRKPRAMVTQTDTNIHTPSYRHRGTKMANNHTFSYTMAVTLRATHLQEQGGKNKGTDRHIPSRTTRDRHTEEHTRAGVAPPQVHSPHHPHPGGLTLEHLGTRP